MDSAFAQYSPLFTSGLLSGRNTPELDAPASRAPSPKRRRHRKEFHDSLPLTVDTATVSFHAAVRSSTDTASDSAMFLTLVPRRHQSDEGRSFLSLDLAESQSMRSMSLRRKDTVTTRATMSFGLGRSEPSSPAQRSPTPRLPELTFSQFAVPSVPKFRRPSRETLSLPSAKPAPSANLPEPPVPLSSRRRRASNLTLTLSACLTTAMSIVSPTSPMHRPSRSEPSLMSPPLHSSPILSPGAGQSYFLFSPVSPTASTSSPPLTAASTLADLPLPLTPASAPAVVPLRASPSFRSVVSVRTRQRNRSAALAMLEGRVQPVRPRNFMSMSDDEDDEEEDRPTGNGRLLQVLQEEEDVVVPSRCPPARPESSALGMTMAPPPPPSSARDCASWWSGSGSGSGTSSTPSKRSRRSTIESFLSPLANFIDLGLDDERASRGWRSFVEISS